MINKGHAKIKKNQPTSLYLTKNQGSYYLYILFLVYLHLKPLLYDSHNVPKYVKTDVPDL